VLVDKLIYFILSFLLYGTTSNSYVTLNLNFEAEI
jgi:hypothetical protein